MPRSSFSQFMQTALSLPLILLLGCSSDPEPSPDGSTTGGRDGSSGTGGTGGGTGGTGGSASTGGTGGSAARDAARTPDTVIRDTRGPDNRGPDSGPRNDGGSRDVATSAFVVTAPWANGGQIPAIHACAMNQWPAISWTAGPAGTASYAFALHDNDFDTHYVIYNIPPATRSLPPIPAGALNVKQGFAVLNNTQWGGPCPPTGSHRYTINVYALNTATYTGPVNTAPAARANLQMPNNAAVIGRASIDGNYQQ